MSQNAHDYLIVNFGGPRSLEEIEPFLTTLLTDPEVIRTKLPNFLQNLLFRRIAKKRAIAIRKEYAHMGGASPIYADTETIREALQKKLSRPIFTYHRYLPATHKATFAALEASQAKNIVVFPMFPQFSYATTGSAARHIKSQLTGRTEKKLLWIPSYGQDSDFVALFVNRIRMKLKKAQIAEENLVLLFSAHGLPESFVEEGDPYASECERSFETIAAHFPLALSKLAYQSQFGRGKWLAPSTLTLSKEVRSWHEGREHILFIPLSFTSDHIETLVEVEQQYMPLIREQNLSAHRLDAFNQGFDWIDFIQKKIEQSTSITSRMLQRSKR